MTRYLPAGATRIQVCDTTAQPYEQRQMRAVLKRRKPVRPAAQGSASGRPMARPGHDVTAPDQRSSTAKTQGSDQPVRGRKQPVSRVSHTILERE